MNVELAKLRIVARREVYTVARTPIFGALLAGMAAIVLGVAWTGGGAESGFVPAVVDLLTPVEMLVPVVAFAFGYRVLLGDRQRGELDVLSTYPLSRLSVVLGVFVGRGVVLAGGVVASLLPAALLVALTSGPKATVFATQAGADSVVLYGRFVVLTALFALVVLALAIAVSAVARGTRGAVALVVLFWLLLVVGADLGIVAALAEDVVGNDALVTLLAVSPNSAYRGLVLQSVVSAATVSPLEAASPVANLVSLLGWAVASLGVGVATVWTD